MIEIKIKRRMQMRQLLHAITPCKIDSRVFVVPRRGTPNHQSRIWQQFGGAGRAPSDDFRESWGSGRRQPTPNHSFAAAKLPIIIFLHQTINTRFDMIAWRPMGTTEENTHCYYGLLCVIAANTRAGTACDYLHCLI